MRFFIDNCLPPRWAPALAALGGVEVTHLRARFPNDITDVEWIHSLADEGDWTIISGDLRITRSLHERQAWHSSGLTAFFLSKGWNIEFWEKTVRIVRWWPKIMEQANLVQPGAGFFVPSRFRDGKFEQVPLSRRST